jgi:Na+-driven multidrug efflux pump
MVVNYIFFEEKTEYLAGVTFITAIINVGLNFLFINTYGAIGAAIATTITFFIKFVFVWYLSSRVHKMPWNIIKSKIN